MTRYLFSLIILLSVVLNVRAVTWYDGHSAVSYSVVGKTSPVVTIALQMFHDDMVAVTGKAPHHAKKANIEIYQLDMANAKTLSALDKMNVLSLRLMDRKDAFFLGVRGGKIIIVGNNGRGTAYGILELSRLAGVSPWTWWGDVVPEKRDMLTLSDTYETLQSPSVEYRGIFINDEDWSTRVWSQQIENGKLKIENGKLKIENSAGGDIAIGPRTYKRIFQLLLRLRANAVWPAMHEGTEAFFAVKGNKEMADSCGIVVGSSHCEPLLRNNVGEWDKAKRGDYNFISNRHNVENYWAERLTEMKGSEGLFTIGMRGIHDGSMEGVKTAKEKFDGLQSVIDCQRELIAKHYDKNVDKVPQVFIPYKEVLEIFEQGLRVPEDVTLLWCDDNYGYMTRLSTAEEQKRAGGAGIYYHLSYWGRPHDYLWLTTTPPGLVYNELRQAYDHNARKLWIVNVHDVKVAAYQLSLAMDMAWDINSVTPVTIRQHLLQWLTQQLGEKTAKAILPAMEEYYRLTAIRRPEFMGWTQVELDKKRYPGGKSLPTDTEFSETEFGGELERYIEQYDAIVDVVRAQKRDDATYFAHVLYPVECAAAMAHKHLDAQLGDTLSAVEAQQRIKELTKRYNTMCDGKWNGLMDYKPRNLPVFADYTLSDSTSIRRSKSRPLSEIALEGSVVRNACDYQSATGTVQPIEMLGHSQKALSVAKGSSVTFSFEAKKEGRAVLRTAVIPTHANDNGDIRFSVSVDGAAPVVYSLKEPYRSERWKKNVLRGQAVRTTDVAMTPGTHSVTITALDDHIILDQWMLDYRKERKFYVFPIKK
ncbi:MAG: glycosyl hydrolase 115 family protein [Prevotella sp.]|nr:glycosyl hydrolase 115 family protein [Candidatus Prevotella equi]